MSAQEAERDRYARLAADIITRLAEDLLTYEILDHGLVHL